MTHPDLSRALARARYDDLRRAAARTPRGPVAAAPGIETEPVTLRFAFPDDASALAHLADLDSASVPPAPLLVAEVAGELRAALSLAGGEVIANPFRRSAHLIELLRARADQLAGPERLTRWGRLARPRRWRSGPGPRVPRWRPARPRRGRSRADRAPAAG